MCIFRYCIYQDLGRGRGWTGVKGGLDSLFFAPVGYNQINNKSFVLVVISLDFSSPKLNLNHRLEIIIS